MSRLLTGTVVSAKMDKTAVVSVVRKLQHPIYKKTITRSKKYKAHVEGIEVGEGDLVEIQEVRPLSRDKHFAITQVVKKHQE